MILSFPSSLDSLAWVNGLVFRDQMSPQIRSVLILKPPSWRLILCQNVDAKLRLRVEISHIFTNAKSAAFNGACVHMVVI